MVEALGVMGLVCLCDVKGDCARAELYSDLLRLVGLEYVC